MKSLLLTLSTVVLFSSFSVEAYSYCYGKDQVRRLAQRVVYETRQLNQLFRNTPRFDVLLPTGRLFQSEVQDVAQIARRHGVNCYQIQAEFDQTTTPAGGLERGVGEVQAHGYNRRIAEQFARVRSAYERLGGRVVQL